MREVAASLGYQVNPIARSLKTSRSETVGVLVPDLTNPLFPPIVRGIEDTLAEQRLHRPDGEHRQRPRSAPPRTSRRMQARQVDGFIVATALLDDPFMHEAAARGCRWCWSTGRPSTWTCRRSPATTPPGSTAPSTTWSSSATATSRTSPGRCRSRPAPSGCGPSGPRCTGTGCATTASSTPRPTPRRPGATALLDLLGDERPTAVVAGNDLLAIGCYDALEEPGLSCPDDMSIVGFNDMPFISRLQPPLTSVRVPQYELGVEAARLLLDRLSGRTVDARGWCCCR